MGRQNFTSVMEKIRLQKLSQSQLNLRALDCRFQKWLLHYRENWEQKLLSVSFCVLWIVSVSDVEILTLMIHTHWSYFANKLKIIATYQRPASELELDNGDSASAWISLCNCTRKDKRKCYQHRTRWDKVGRRREVTSIWLILPSNFTVQLYTCSTCHIIGIRRVFGVVPCTHVLRSSWSSKRRLMLISAPSAWSD